MIRPHVGACTCPACCPDKWDANRIASQRLAIQATAQQSVTMAPWPQTMEYQMEVLRVRIDALEAIIKAHVRLADNGN